MNNESDSVETALDASYIIQVSENASLLIDQADRLGLLDVKYWTTSEIMQEYIQSGKRIAFSAFDAINSGSSEMPSGIIVGGLEEEGRLWIELLVVDKKKRRRGIATALVEKLAEFGREHKLRALFVDLDDDNEVASEFYKAVEFRDAGTISEYYWDSSDAIILYKRL
ncbi:MAG: GNAT family N-acetyltransferase [Candidatus Thorarchaeota archaeon]